VYTVIIVDFKKKIQIRKACSIKTLLKEYFLKVILLQSVHAS